MKQTPILSLMILLVLSLGCSTQPENDPPERASVIYPVSNAADIFVSTTLYWTASDPNSDPLTFDIYFGTNPSPPLIQSNFTETHLDPGTLQYETSYYWKVDVKDEPGNVTEGEIWHFETMAEAAGYQCYYLAAGSYSAIEGNYHDPDPVNGIPWIALSSHGSYGASAQWEFWGFSKPVIETLTVGAFSYDDGWDITGGEHYQLFNFETEEWDFLFDSNKQEQWRYAELTGASAKPYVNDTTNRVILRLEAGYTDHSHIREVFCTQAELDTTYAEESAPGAIKIRGGMINYH